MTEVLERGGIDRTMSFEVVTVMRFCDRYAQAIVSSSGDDDTVGLRRGLMWGVAVLAGVRMPSEVSNKLEEATPEELPIFREVAWRSGIEPPQTREDSGPHTIAKALVEMYDSYLIKWIVGEGELTPNQKVSRDHKFWSEQLEQVIRAESDGLFSDHSPDLVELFAWRLSNRKS